METLAYTIDNNCDGSTVYAVLREKLGVSDAIVRRAKAVEGGITLDGLSVRANERVRPGQTVSIFVGDMRTAKNVSHVKPEPGPLDIAYEDDSLVIVNKPAGVVVHPGPAHKHGTLCNFLAYHLQERGCTCNPHPVQRLDGSTSGLITFAKNAHVQNLLQAQLHTNAFSRTYLAICAHPFDSERAKTWHVVDAPIARISRGPSIFAVRDDGKRAVTHYRVLAQGHAENRAYALVQLQLETGRTHQIRLHMRHIGHELAGDTTYGVPSMVINRPALHAWQIKLVHPLTNEHLCLEAPLPSDLYALANAAGLTSGLELLQARHQC